MENMIGEGGVCFHTGDSRLDGLVRCPGDAINPTGSMSLPKTAVTRQLQPEI